MGKDEKEGGRWRKRGRKGIRKRKKKSKEKKERGKKEWEKKMKKCGMFWKYPIIFLIPGQLIGRPWSKMATNQSKCYCACVKRQVHVEASCYQCWVLCDCHIHGNWINTFIMFCDKIFCLSSSLHSVCGFLRLVTKIWKEDILNRRWD